MPAYISSKLTRVTLDAERTIESGSTIRVQGILVANGTSDPKDISFNDSDGTEILTISVGANSSESWSSSFIAQNGLVIETEGNAAVVVTIAHGAAGA